MNRKLFNYIFLGMMIASPIILIIAVSMSSFGIVKFSPVILFLDYLLVSISFSAIIALIGGVGFYLTSDYSGEETNEYEK